MRTITFPTMGIYTLIIENAFKNCGFNVITPTINKKTIQMGSIHLDELMCFPAKVTLGTLIQAIKKGATDLIIISTEGMCRFRGYGFLHRQVLKRLGYKINYHIISLKHPIFSYKILKRINPNLNFFKLVKEVYKGYKKVVNIEEEKQDNISPKILIIGEFYTCLENTVNMNIEEKLRNFKVGVINSLSLSHLIRYSFRINWRERKAKQKAEQIANNYFGDVIGGHAIDSLINLIYYRDKVKGVIHLAPFPCAPESMISKILDYAADDFNLPILHIHIDENISETNILNRLEAFTEMIKWKQH